MNLLTIKEAAKILKVSEKTLRRWEAKNYITPIRTAGKHRRYSIDQLKTAKKNKSHSTQTETIQIDTELFRPVKNDIEISASEVFPKTIRKNSFSRSFVGYLGLAMIATSGLTYLKIKSSVLGTQTAFTSGGLNNQSVLAATSFQNSEFSINIPTTLNAGVIVKNGLTIENDTVTDLTGNGLSIVNGALTAETSPLGNSITSPEIVDGTISETDLLVTNTPSNSQYLTFNSTTGGFTWITPETPTDEVGTNFFTDDGDITYLTSTTDDFAIGGTGTTAPFFIDSGTGTISLTKSASGKWINFSDGTDEWGLYNYAGSPEGNITANTGTLAMDTANGTLYVKTDDGDATNWINLATGVSSPWDQAAGLVTLGTTTNNINVGGSTNLAKLSVDGDSDEVQLLVQGNSTQTSDLVVFENSAGLDLFKIANNGSLTLGSTLTSFTNTIQQSSSQAADITYTLPVDDGLGANYVLATDGAGILSWQSVSGIGGMASFILSGDSGSTQTISDSNTLLISGGVNGIDTTTSATDVITLDIDTTEIGENTFGNNTDASIVWTFDQTGVTDPTLTFSDGLIAVGGDLAISGGNVTTSVTFDGTVTVSNTTTTNGTLTANGSVTLGDGGDTAVINSSDWDISAVGDMTGIGNITIDGRFDSAAHANNIGFNLPTFAGAPSPVTGTSEGDIVYDTVSDALYIYDGGSFTAIGGGGYSGWTLAGDTGTPETIASGNTGNILGGVNGIDTVVSATDTLTLNFDATEVGTVTFGAGSAITWTFDASAGTDTTLSFGNNTVTATAATISLSGNVDISNGADISGANLTVGGSNFSVNVGNGNITTVGTVSSNTNESINGIDINAGTISDVDNLTINSGGDLTIGAIGLNDVGSTNITSGASLVGVYDEFTNSASTTVQDVLNDLDAAIGAGASKFTQDTGFVYLTTTTDSVTIGGNTELGKLAVDGNADEVQLLVQGNGTQNANLVVFENSTGTDQLTLTNSGDLTINGDLAITGGNITSNVTFDSAVNFTPSGTNDITLNVDADSLLTLDSSVANADNFIISPNNSGTGTSFSGTLTSSNLTADRTWTLQDNDGTLAFLTDIPTSDNYQSWTLAGDTGSSQTISSTNTGTIAGGTNGVDTVAGATDTLTINLDTTEIGTNTFGSGSGITWTFDASAGTDTSIAFGNNTLDFTAGTTTFSGAVAVNGNSLTVGSNGTDGALTLYSEMGVTDYSVILQPSNSQTGNTTYTLPIAYAAGANYVLTSDTSGVMSWQEVTSVGGAGDITAVGDITSGAAFTATAGNDGNTLYFEGTTSDGNEIALTGADSGSDTIVTIPAIAGTLASLSGTQVFDGAKSFTDASGVTIGLDSATNTAGILKLISAGANNFSTIFQTGTQTQDITYTLPLNDGDSDYALTTDGAGVLTWKAIAGVGGVGDIAAVGNITSGDAFTSGTPGTSLYFVNGGDLLDANGNEVLTLTTTASAVNELTLANAAANGNVTLSATGGDTDIDIQTILKGTGTSIFSSSTANTDRIAIKPQTGTASSTFTGTLTSLDLTGDRTYTLKDADGTIAFTSDIPTSDNYQYFTLDGDDVTTEQIGSTQTLLISGGTNGIDTDVSATDTITLNLDTTEIGTNTFGSGSGITWTFDGSSGTDTTIAFGDNAITLTSATTTLSGDLAINGGNITTALTADSTVTVSGTLTANGLVTLGDGGDTVAINSSDWDISTTGDLTGIGAITADGAISFTPSGTNDITFGVDTDTLLTLDSTVANADNFVISPNNTGTGATFTGTLTSSNLTANRTWTLQDGDGTIAFTSDIPVSDNYSSWNLAGDTGTPEAISSGNTGNIVGGTNGIDTAVSATDTLTINLDTTEINDTTFGNNSDASIVWTFDQSGVTDPTITFTSDTVSLSGDLAINGGNITTALTLDSTLTTTGTSTLNGLTTVNDDFTVALTGNENVEITDGATPTTDTLSLVANGATTTSGVNAAQIDFTTGDGANSTNSGLEINMASGGTVSGDITNAINLTMDAADASTQKGLNFGDNNFDTDINATTDLTFGIGNANELILTATDFSPSTSDGNALGTTSLMWSDLFLASGAVINFNNGDVTVTHATDSLSFAGGDYNFDVVDGKSANIDGDGSPTADVLVLGASDVTATDGVDALSISFAAADGANLTNSALNISLTSNGTAAGDLMRGLFIDLASVANAASTNKAIEIENTTAWDTDIELQNDETIDNTTDGTITLTATNTALSGDLAISGGNITTAFTADSSVTITGTTTTNGTLTANGTINLGDGGDVITISGSDTNISITDGSTLNIDGDGTPTADLVLIGNGDSISTTGVDGLSINFTQADDTDSDTNAGINLTMAPSNDTDSADILSGINISTSGALNTSGSYYGINIENLTYTDSANANAINIGSGWVNGINSASQINSDTTDKTSLSATSTSIDNDISSIYALISTGAGAATTADGMNVVINNSPVDSGDTINGLRVSGASQTTGSTIQNLILVDPSSASSNTAGNLNGININTISLPGAATETAIAIGTGWDSIINYNGTPVINGSGQLVASQLTGTLLTLAGDSGSGAIAQGNTITVAGGTNGIDTSESGTTVTLNIDTTEVGTTTFGSGSAVTWTFDASAGTDTTIAFGDNSITLTSATTTLSGDLAINGGNITTALTLDSTLTTTGTSTLNGLTTVNDDFTVALTGNENVEITDGATPTTDTLNITANGATVTTDANALEINFTTGDGTNATNSGLEINMASGGTASGDITNAINLTMDAADASTQIGLNFGDNNFDTDVNATTDLTFGIGGANELTLTGTALSPTTTDGNALGTTSLMWSDLFLATGAVINYNNGDVTLTNAADLLTMAGGDLTVDFTGNQNLEITDGATPTTDTVNITANGATVTTDANALEIDFTTGDGTNVTNSGLQIDMASGGTASGDITNAINLTMDAADASTQKGLNFGNNNFDIDINAVTDLTLGIGDTSEVSLTATNFAPTAAEGNTLGSATAEWEQIFVGDDNGISFGLDQDWTMAYDQAGDSRLELVTAGTSGLLIQTANATGTSLNLTTNALTTGTGMLIDNSANTLTTGTLLQAQSTGTSLTTAADAFLGYFDWTPGSATTASGDLFRINIGANGNVTNLFNVTDAGTSLFRVSETGIESAVPHTFSAAGDVNIAYDLIMTNQTASTIDSYGPLTVRAGESFESNNLTLTSYNSGNILLNTGATAGKVAVGANVTPLGLLTVDSTGTAAIGKAALTVIQDESQDIITASASATTRFTVNSAGNTFVTLRNTATSAVCHVTNGAGYDELTDCLTSVAADYAERYPVAQGISYGDVVMIGTNDVTTTDGKVIKQLVKSNSAYQNNVLGITSDNWGDFTSAGDNVLPEDNPMPVALSGRVPVKIASNSEPINSGDFITSSSEEGKAMKAVTAGKVIATALESWAPNSGKETIMVFVNNFYYTPVPENSVTREEIEQLLQITEQNQQLLEESQNWNTNTATTSGEFTDLITNNLFVTGIAAFDSLSISNSLTLNNNLVIGNGNIDSLTTPLNIQGSAAQALNFMAGKVSIDTSGNMIVQGDLKVLGTLDANKVNVSSQIAGTGTIVAGTNEVILSNTNIKVGGLIFVTPTSPTKDSIYVKSQIEGQAVIGFEAPLNPTTTDITFNWWIVGISN